MFGLMRFAVRAYGRWQHALIWQDPPHLPNPWPPNQPMLGVVGRSYQRARRGTKVWVHFGSYHGQRDTWWEGRRPPARGTYVVVVAHVWNPPGTHSGREVIWIDQVIDVLSPWLVWRGRRHARRLARRDSPDPYPDFTADSES